MRRQSPLPVLVLDSKFADRGLDHPLDAGGFDRADIPPFLRITVMCRAGSVFAMRVSYRRWRVGANESRLSD